VQTEQPNTEINAHTGSNIKTKVHAHKNINARVNANANPISKTPKRKYKCIRADTHENTKAKVPKLRLPNENSQAKAPKLKFPS